MCKIRIDGCAFSKFKMIHVNFPKNFFFQPPLNRTTMMIYRLDKTVHLVNFYLSLCVCVITYQIIACVNGFYKYTKDTVGPEICFIAFFVVFFVVFAHCSIKLSFCVFFFWSIDHRKTYAIRWQHKNHFCLEIGRNCVQNSSFFMTILLCLMCVRLKSKTDKSLGNSNNNKVISLSLQLYC